MLLVGTTFWVSASATSSSGVTEQACADEQAFRSTSFSTTTSVRIQNDRSDVVTTYWLNYDGQRVFYNTLPPGYYVPQQTFATHPWLIVAGSGACLGIFVATPSAGTILLTSTPSAPRALSVVAGPAAGEVSLTWQAPQTDSGHVVTSYRIHRGTSADAQSLVATVGSGASFRDTGLANGATLHYRVTAVNSQGESGKSNNAFATTFATPGAPRDVRAAPGSDAGSAIVTWSPPASSGGTPVTAYVVLRGTPGTQPTFLAEVGNVGSYVDRDLDLLQNYEYVIRARNLVGEGGSSLSSCTKPFPWLAELGSSCSFPSPP